VRASGSPGIEPRRPIPESAAARHDDIHAALHALGDERRRLERLGFELPLARCHHETRYWQFLSALFTASSDPAASPGRGDFPCPDARER
jgi:hypothetical protein